MDQIKKNSVLRVTSDQGILYNSNGLNFQIIHGFSVFNNVQDLFDKGWYLTKKGGLILPLAVDEHKRSKVFALYVGLNKYFKKNFGYNLWVAHGSLLGLYRDRALIPFDDDFDLAYLSRMTNQREIMFERIHIASKMKLDGWNMSFSATGLFKLMPKDEVGDPEKDKYLDIMPAWWQNNHLFCLAWTMFKITPEDMMPLQEVEYYGTKFLFPRRPEVFLRHKYGPGWNTPNKGYTPKRPAGSDQILNQGMARPAEVAMFSL
ncbi:LicD family protein [Desulfonatronovibrio magnus]|uniref:LicD family protein n=1 Tax=Desulfonatronovibrio magnus TaxID=698827 RepID=UPI0005EACE0A|nr:LicD family protein [Desulfonatronovibrio magnus]